MFLVLTQKRLTGKSYKEQKFTEEPTTDTMVGDIKRKEVIKMKKTLSIIGKGLIIAFAAWFLISWCDIMADNSAPNPQHLQWNMFTTMFPEVGK